jgi:hypothetical protein
MFPWFTAIEEDHERMENPRCVQWREIADCLRNLTGPIRESLGSKPRGGMAGRRFPGSVAVHSTYSLCLALIGQRRWTVPAEKGRGAFTRARSEYARTASEQLQAAVEADEGMGTRGF